MIDSAGKAARIQAGLIFLEWEFLQVTYCGLLKPTEHAMLWTWKQSWYVIYEHIGDVVLNGASKSVPFLQAEFTEA